jgi:hypothetical protein
MGGAGANGGGGSSLTAGGSAGLGSAGLTGATGSTAGGGSGGSTGITLGGAGNGGTSSVQPAGDPFQIQLDYTYDTQGAFMDNVRRNELDYAAHIWGLFIASDFEDIPAGTPLRARPPEMPDAAGMVFSVDYTIDDLALIVGFAAIDGAGGALANSSLSFTVNGIEPGLAQRLDARYYSNPFQPWIGRTTFDVDEAWFFDSTPETFDDIPIAQNDFLETAMHEMGHMLGIGSAAAFTDLVVNGTFQGARAMEVYGAAVPLAPDNVHILRNTMSGGRLPVMEYGSAPGQRKAPTELDLAILEDLGYQIRWDIFNATAADATN